MNRLTRRPRFLSGVPENPSPEPARFTSFLPRAAAGPSAPQGEVPAEPPPARPPPAEVRREALERLGAAVTTLRAQADRLAEQARADAIEIGFQVARKILESELRQSPEALFSLVRSALRRAGESRRIAIHVAPEDAALLQSDEGRAALEGLTAARIEYVADPALQHGDCVIDADFGQVDGRLTTRIAEIRRAVDAASEGAA
jgi:flagellar assembly protein FliH